ncbi:hypothetical protein EC973_006414 [Apophysomyces ossiformis]|uniref:Uncharacterized protein n=1 Tax=Apophysomyces ossiformis TaxID=679940 RepID=A0A8H7BVT9_9FUNG|nr:hypothetical protein EC973_006414 [Apophysomyces ossiformis]
MSTMKLQKPDEPSDTDMPPPSYREAMASHPVPSMPLFTGDVSYDSPSMREPNTRTQQTFRSLHIPNEHNSSNSTSSYFPDAYNRSVSPPTDPNSRTDPSMDDPYQQEEISAAKHSKLSRVKSIGVSLLSRVHSRLQTTYCDRPDPLSMVYATLYESRRYNPYEPRFTDPMPSDPTCHGRHPFFFSSYYGDPFRTPSLRSPRRGCSRGRERK